MRKFMLAFVFGALLLPGSGFTVGLGEIEVNSALNQELDAEIALLSATAADAEQMIVKLASSDEFNRAGLDRPYLLSSLRFKIYAKNGEPWIKVTSPRPIREPFLNFLVEIDWPQGHLLREYTILLDPPVFMTADQTTTTARPAAQDASRPAASSSTAPTAAPPPAAAPMAVPAANDNRVQNNAPVVTDDQASYTRPAWAPSDGHRVQKGDTAWSLASKLRPDDSVTVEQMMIAMLRSNPEVFINGNINGLKRGYILRVPDRASLGDVSHNEAVAMVREQGALWREYQSELASGVPASSISTASVGTPAADVDTGTDARLNIVSAGSDAGMSTGEKDPTAMSPDELRAQLALASEQLETERLEKEALVGKVDRLEGQVDKMKRMLTIEDADMAQMQSAQSPAEAMDDASTATDDDSMTDMDEMAAVEADEPVESDVADAGSDIDAESAEGMDTEVAEAMDGETDQVFMDETTEDQQAAAEQAIASETTPVDAADFLDTEPQDIMAPAQSSPLDAILNNPIVLGAIALGVLLVGGLIAFLARRRKSNAKPAVAAASTLPVEDELEDVADMIEDEALGDDVSDELVEAEMAEAEADAEEDDYDAESTMILPSADDTIITPTEDEAEDAERDDVIAEADVYLAYGIYQQAEELLSNAINENPDRDLYRVKLAETHYASKNAEAFVAAATGLKEQSGIDTKAWAKVAAMGQDLCPDNAMFTAGAVTGDVALDELMPKAPEMDIDLASDAEATPDLDFSLDGEQQESPLDLPETEDATAILDLGDIEEPASAEEEPSAIEDELEFDISDTDAVKEEKQEDDEFLLDIGADELDLGETPAELEDEEEIDLSAELESTAIMDLGEALEPEAESADDDIDLDLGLGEAVEEAAEVVEDDIEIGLDEEIVEAVEAEVSGTDDDIDLELGLDDAAEELLEATPAAEPEISAESPAEQALDELDLDMGLGDDDGLGDLGDIDEVATKLDLARAYLDMGDSEGTRSILDEVVAEGSETQKKEAQDILDQL